MGAPDYRMQQEDEAERMAYELGILSRIKDRDDALYVAASFGLTNEFKWEKQHEVG